MNSLILILIVVVFIALPLVQIRKQNQRMKQIREFQDSLQPGMVVQMTSGIQGRVAHVGDTSIDLEISPAVVTTWDRAAVLQAVNSVEPGSQQEEQLSNRPDDQAETVDSDVQNTDFDVDGGTSADGESRN
ncbi:MULTISPECIES: preprotein translocase subunit YajC [Corynebacterium]|uniref:preprotein translocase subunit YajC n=1 Tax=Corynebacterium TaxID=1716 RepID=UPI00254B86D9|nr:MULTISPECIES: preprotein translocase subunit YajC [Corynebacterium]MDK8790280.1 preprotein translocase subunit YajC [Corynebacterium sp. MSK039]WOH95320.1 preprotein translocase subunit YajC [Corynebacterium urealyticum]